MRNPSARYSLALLGALSLTRCLQAQPEVVGEADDAVVDGTITWERPEVGTILIGGGMCTATLITPNVAVTAAHCVDFRTVSRPGSYGRFILQASPSAAQQRYTIDMYRSFGNSDEGDVAVLHLAETVPASIATPAGIAARQPANGEPLTLFGFGCTRRNTSNGSGQKRKFNFAQGQGTARLCPGDSGGPVMWDREVAVTRVNSAYVLDSTGRDIFGDIPRNHARIVEQIAAWGSTPARNAGEGAPPPTPTPPTPTPPTPTPPTPTPPTPTPPAPSACGMYAGWNVWTCIDARTRVRCVSDALQRETCANGCEGRPAGVDDVCASVAPMGEACGRYAGWDVWSCIDGTTRVRCIANQLQRDNCASGCVPQPPGVDDYCRTPSSTPGGSTPSTGRDTGEGCSPSNWSNWLCRGRDLVTCRGGRLFARSCVSGCESRAVPNDHVCLGGEVGATPTPPTPTPTPPTPTPPTPMTPAPMTPAPMTPAPMTPAPSGDVSWTTWRAQQTRTNASWGAALTDIIQHLPASYGSTYADSDLVTYGHETTHGINAHARNYLNNTGGRANAFYCLTDRVALVVEPGIRKADVAPYVPASLRGSRFGTYVTGQTAWDDRPLYIWDEWVAYTNGSEVALGLHRAGQWRYGWRDAVAGTVEFTAYALAVGAAVEARDPTYFQSNTQFRAFLAWNARRAMTLFREGAAVESFRMDAQDALYRALRESPDAEPLRAFARRVYGRAWAAEVLGLAP